jgi:formylglycine-generating enzyme required for sulfatase activity
VGWPAEDGVTYEVWYGTTSESGAAAQWHGAINRPETGVTAGTAITGLANGTPCYVWIKTEAAGFGEKTAGTPEAPPASVGGDFVYVPGGTVTGSADYAFTVKVPDNAAYNNPGSSSVQKGVFVEDRRIEEMGSFVMAKHETTRQLWYTVQEWARQNGYAFQNTINAPSLANENKPVANISWRDAIIWCNAYSEMTEGGLEPVYRDSGGNVLKDSTDAAACDAAIMDKNKTGYRLPTEVEREFAARGGDPGRADWMYMYAGSDDAEDVAWHHGNSGTTQAVGEKDPNRLGIYDLSGNVQEWCGDWMHWARDVTRETPVDGAVYHQTSANQKAFNGGGAGSNPTMSCVAYRWGYPPNYKDSYVGFRVVRKP